MAFPLFILFPPSYPSPLSHFWGKRGNGIKGGGKRGKGRKTGENAEKGEEGEGERAEKNKNGKGGKDGKVERGTKEERQNVNRKTGVLFWSEMGNFLPSVFFSSLPSFSNQPSILICLNQLVLSKRENFRHRFVQRYCFHIYRFETLCLPRDTRLFCLSWV